MNRSECVDEAALIKLRKLGGASLLGQIIDLFLENAPKRIEAARVGERAGDLKSVERAAHSLKSSARNVGATRLGELAERIEHLAAGRKCDEIPDLLSSLEEAYSEVRIRLEDEREGLVG